MNLLDFFIRISVKGQDTVRELSRITQASSRTKAALNATGASATKATNTLKRLGNEAAIAHGKMMKAAKLPRFNVSANAKGSVHANLAGGTPAAIAGAAGGASLYTRAKQIQDMRANQRLAIGNVSFAESEAIAKQLEAAQRQGVSRIVRGRNVLDNASILDIGSAQAEMLKAGEDVKSVIESDVIPAFIAIQRVAGDEASTTDITRALVASRKLGEELNMTRTETAATLISMGTNTTYGVDEVTKAIPRVSGALVTGGQSLEDFGSLLITVNDKFQTAVLAANATSQMMKFTMRPATKKANREIDDRLGIDYYVDGKFKGMEYVRQQLKKLAADDLEAAQLYATTRFGDRGGIIALDLMQTTDEEMRAARKKAQAGDVRAMDNTLLKQRESLDGSLKKFAEGWNHLSEALVKAGVLDILGEFLEKLATGLDMLTAWVNENPEMVQGLLKGLLGLLSVVLLVRGAFMAWRIGAFLTRLLGVGRFFALIKGWGGKLGFLARWGSRAFGILGTAIRIAGMAVFWLIAAFAAILGIPVWVMAAIVAAVAAAAALIWYYWDEIKIRAMQAWTYLKEQALGALNAIYSAAMQYLSPVISMLSTVGNAISTGWTALKNFGANASSQFSAGLATPGMGLTPLGFGSSTYVDNRRVYGATPRQVETTARSVTRASDNTRNARSNNRR